MEFQEDLMLKLKLMFTGTIRTRFNKVRMDEKWKTLIRNALVRALFMALSMVNVKETYLCNIHVSLS